MTCYFLKLWENLYKLKVNRFVLFVHMSKMFSRHGRCYEGNKENSLHITVIIHKMEIKTNYVVSMIMCAI